MLLGIIADSHDRLDMVEKAVQFFNTQKLDYVLHAGDFVAPFTAKYFARLTVPLIGVFGNNDGEKQGLQSAFEPHGSIFERPHCFELKGYKIALLHEPVDLDSHLKHHRLVIYGHTHTRLVKHGKNAVLINPGESCGYLTGSSTVAVVDCKTRKVSFKELQ